MVFMTILSSLFMMCAFAIFFLLFSQPTPDKADEEMTLSQGDKISVDVQNENGWWLG